MSFTVNYVLYVGIIEGKNDFFKNIFRQNYSLTACQKNRRPSDNFSKNSNFLKSDTKILFFKFVITIILNDMVIYNSAIYSFLLIFTTDFTLSLRFKPKTSSKSFRCRSIYTSSLDLINDFPLSTTAATAICSFGVAKLLDYGKLSYIAANTVTGIPPNSCIVDLDINDGKNIFYLSQNCSYTGIISIKDDISTPSKVKEKVDFVERLVLESVGKANMYDQFAAELDPRANFSLLLF